MFETIITDFHNLASIAWLFVLLNIIVIDLIMSWDNAIIIWMATRNLAKDQRKKAIFIGIILATVFRIILSIFAFFLLWVVWLKLAWWLLLLYVVWKLYKELRNEEEQNSDIKAKDGFMYAIYTILIADISMSLDNVLAVSGASHGNIVALGTWLIFSIILMAFASNYIAKNLTKYPQIQWIWLIVILFVAIEMIINGTKDIAKISSSISFSNLFSSLLVIIWFIFAFLHNKYIKKADEKHLKKFLEEKYLIIFTIFLFLLLALIFAWNKVSVFLENHEAIKYGIVLIIFLMILEFISLFRNKK